MDIPHGWKDYPLKLIHRAPLVLKYLLGLTRYRVFSDGDTRPVMRGLQGRKMPIFVGRNLHFLAGSQIGEIPEVTSEKLRGPGKPSPPWKHRSG
jgi:hypothetical protein